MAQLTFRGTTQAMSFPLLSEFANRTIIAGRTLDQVYVPEVTPQERVPIDRGVPSAFYAHNVMPQIHGWQSVGFRQVSVGSSLITSRSRVFYIFGAEIPADSAELPISTGFATHLMKSNASLYYTNPSTGNWSLVVGSDSIGINQFTKLTVAHVNGLSYICLSNIGVFVFNTANNSLNKRTLAGLDDEALEGVVASQGYLLAYTTDAISWCSVVNVEDFVPSDISKAGGGKVQEAAGTIVYVAATYLGMILFTTGNAVAITYSGNDEFPWTFKAIASSGGISKIEDVVQEESAGYLHAYTSNGMQQISHLRANSVMPHITDFITGKIFEDFDSQSNTFSRTVYANDLRAALSQISDRYLVISYGRPNQMFYSFALIVDMVQSRMGKVKIQHTECFELKRVGDEQGNTPRNSIAFMASNGLTKVLDFTLGTNEDSVLILGKFQVERSSKIELHSVSFENVNPTGEGFQALALPSQNGKDFEAAVSGYLEEATSRYANVYFDGLIGDNVSLILKNGFTLLSYVIFFSPAGRVNT